MSAPVQANAMAETHSTMAGMEKLGDHVLGIISPNYDLVRHQQEIRDRWYRYYLLTSGAILSLMIAMLGSLPRTATGDPKDSFWSAFQMLGFLVPLALSLIALFGILFLAVYLPQVVNYQLHYLCIARAQETLAAIHAQTLSRNRLPDPFTFAYGRWSRAIPEGTKFWNVATLLNSARKDRQMWGADFFSNLVPICINSFCALGFVLSWFAWQSARYWNCPPSLTCHLLAKWHYYLAIAVAAIMFILQIAARQWFLVYFLWSAEKDFAERYPLEARSGRAEPQSATQPD
jgi:hypothetical protein